MRPTSWLVLASVLVVLAAPGCSKIEPITGPQARGGTADLTRYVALGTSLAAGTESGGTVERHQRFSYPSLFAQQIGVTPLARQSYDADGLSLDGTFPLFRIQSLSPLVVSPAGHTLGVPTRSGYAGDFENLGVPGALVSDVVDSSGYLPARANVHFAHILRHRGFVWQQVGRLQPTFVTFEYGSNEMIGPSTAGEGSAVFPPGSYGVPAAGTYATLLHAALDAVQAAAPGAKLAIVNVPDATLIPFATTFPAFTRNDLGVVTPLIGPGGTPLTPGARVLLTAGTLLAAGDGFPTDCHSYVSGAVGTGNPLPDAVVLTAAEAASLQSDVDGYNAAIAAEASARGAALVDFHGTMQTAYSNGIVYDGVRYTTRYITGGLFSLDGVHPSDLGYGVICNLLIDAVNARFGAAVPRLDLARVNTTPSDGLAPSDHRPRYPIIPDAQAHYARMFGRLPK